jgi:uncharacterized OsmC-like protein
MKNSVQEAQAPLRALYKEAPEKAMVMNQAVTGGVDPTDPFHSHAMPFKEGGASIPFAVHRAVGGPYDAQCPGDMLCAALAACQDLSVRMVANRMGIELIALQVQVKATFDVRGALGIQKDVPVGFQSMTSEVHIKAKEGTPPEMLEQLQIAVERCCVVGQTLMVPPHMQTTFFA